MTSIPTLPAIDFGINLIPIRSQRAMTPRLFDVQSRKIGSPILENPNSNIYDLLLNFTSIQKSDAAREVDCNHCSKANF